MIRIIGPALALALAGFLSACGTASQITTSEPANVNQVKQEGIGAALAQFRYTPVHVWTDKDGKHLGYIFTDCGNEASITKCGNDLHNRGTKDRPNVYVWDNKIKALEGPHDGDNDDRSYYSSVPKDFQDFKSLPKDKQEALLRIMHDIAPVIGHPSDTGEQNINLSIGQVIAWVSRNEPNLDWLITS